MNTTPPRSSTSRQYVDAWRSCPTPAWHVTPETARLLHIGASTNSGFAPFSARSRPSKRLSGSPKSHPNRQVAAAIPRTSDDANNDANPELLRLALKLATGAGKTTVMAMLIAWQTINAVRRPDSKNFTRGFLSSPPASPSRIACASCNPTIPTATTKAVNWSRPTCCDDVNRAKIVITNYHAFKLRERMELSKGGRALLQGRAARNSHPRNRRPNAPARHARSDGHEEHPRPQR